MDAEINLSLVLLGLAFISFCEALYLPAVLGWSAGVACMWHTMHCLAGCTLVPMASSQRWALLLLNR